MKRTAVITFLNVDALSMYGGMDEPCLGFLPVPKKRRLVIIRPLKNFDALKKGKYYKAAFSDKLDSRCSDYLDEYDLWDFGFNEELFEASSTDLFAWVAVEDGSWYFLGDTSYLNPVWEVVEENRRVIVEKTGSR